MIEWKKWPKNEWMKKKMIPTNDSKIDSEKMTNHFFESNSPSLVESVEYFVKRKRETPMQMAYILVQALTKYNRI